MTSPVHHITLTVRDVSESAAWYQELLGEANIIEREGPGWRRIRMDWTNGLVLGVAEYDASSPSEVFSHLKLGLDHIGLACDSEAEVREWAAKLTTLGCVHGPVEEAAYGWAVTARDPNNIPIEFFCGK